MDKTGALKAVGAITTYSAVIYPLYYNVTIGWSLVYLITGFINPLPYSASNEGFVDKCDDSVSRAEQYLRIRVLGTYDEDCQAFKDGDPARFSLLSFLGNVGVWITIFFCVFKGTKISGSIVWITVPLPVIFVLIMIGHGSQLDGAGAGITKYFSGTGEATSAGQQWSDAAG